MPNGTKGRGFVNGSFTWSFRGEAIHRIHDDYLVIPYVGWRAIFPATQSGKMINDFESGGEESLYLAQKESQGYSNIQVRKRYKMGNTEFYELLATYNGQAVRVAGNTKAEMGFASHQPDLLGQWQLFDSGYRRNSSGTFFRHFDFWSGYFRKLLVGLIGSIIGILFLLITPMKDGVTVTSYCRIYYGLNL